MASAAAQPEGESVPMTLADKADALEDLLAWCDAHGVSHRYGGDLASLWAIQLDLAEQEARTAYLQRKLHAAAIAMGLPVDAAAQTAALAELDVSLGNMIPGDAVTPPDGSPAAPAAPSLAAGEEEEEALHPDVDIEVDDDALPEFAWGAWAAAIIADGTSLMNPALGDWTLHNRWELQSRKNLAAELRSTQRQPTPPRAAPGADVAELLAEAIATMLEREALVAFAELHLCAFDHIEAERLANAYAPMRLMAQQDVEYLNERLEELRCDGGGGGGGSAAALAVRQKAEGLVQTAMTQVLANQRQMTHVCELASAQRAQRSGCTRLQQLQAWGTTCLTLASCLKGEEPLDALVAELGLAQDGAFSEVTRIDVLAHIHANVLGRLRSYAEGEEVLARLEQGTEEAARGRAAMVQGLEAAKDAVSAVIESMGRLRAAAAEEARRAKEREAERREQKERARRAAAERAAAEQARRAAAKQAEQREKVMRELIEEEAAEKARLEAKRAKQQQQQQQLSKGKGKPARPALLPAGNQPPVARADAAARAGQADQDQENEQEQRQAAASNSRFAVLAELPSAPAPTTPEQRQPAPGSASKKKHRRSRGAAAAAKAGASAAAVPGDASASPAAQRPGGGTPSRSALTAQQHSPTWRPPPMPQGFEERAPALGGGDEELANECICMEQEADAVCVPCGHVVLCGGCARRCKAAGHRDCPVCCAALEGWFLLKENLEIAV